MLDQNFDAIRWVLHGTHPDVHGSVTPLEDGRFVVKVLWQGEVFAREHYGDEHTAVSRSTQFRRVLEALGFRNRPTVCTDDALFAVDSQAHQRVAQ